MKHATLVLTATLGLSACVTTKGATEDKAPAGAVVSQVSLKAPILSSHDRQYWLDMRQSKELMPKLAGSLATGEADVAQSVARAYLAKNPGDPRALTMLAAALAMGRSYELADYYALLAERAQPGNAAALNIRGLALMLGSGRKVADYRKAQEFFRQAFDADATQIAAGLNGGALALELGNPTQAGELYQAVVSRCDRCVSGLMGLGVAMARSGKWDVADQTFREVLKKKPNHPHALYNLALVRKNGYNDSKQAESHLFALLNESRTKDVALREKAQTVLRMIKGEATREERSMMADDEVAAPAGSQAMPAEPSLGDQRDAEMLMTGDEMKD